MILKQKAEFYSAGNIANIKLLKTTMWFEPDLKCFPMLSQKFKPILKAQ